MNDITKNTDSTTPEENTSATPVAPPKRKISVYKSGGAKIGEYENVPQITAKRMIGNVNIVKESENHGKTAAHVFNDALRGQILSGPFTASTIINYVRSPEANSERMGTANVDNTGSALDENSSSSRVETDTPSLQSGKIPLKAPAFKEQFRLKLYQLPINENNFNSKSSSKQKPSQLYTFLKLEYEKVLKTLADKTSQQKKDILTAHMNLVMSTFWVEVSDLFYTDSSEAKEKNRQDPRVFNKIIKEIANDSQLCWMLAVYASRITNTQLEISEQKKFYSVRSASDRKTEVFTKLSQEQNSFFYKYISSIQLRWGSLEGSLLQNIFNNPRNFFNKQQAQEEDRGSMFFPSLDPLVIPDVNQKPTFYAIENQSNLFEFYPYTNLDKIVNQLSNQDKPNVEFFQLLVVDLMRKEFSASHFCIMLKYIFVKCAYTDINDDKFQKINKAILDEMQVLLTDHRVMKLLSKIPQFFPILSKYIENLPPLPQGKSFKDTYPIVHHFRYHTDFNLNLFRARKEAERNTNQTTNNASVVNHIIEKHLNKSCLSMSWWLEKKPTGAQYQQVYENVSTVVDTYSNEKTITVKKIIEDLTQEKTDLSKGLMVLVSFNRRKALGFLEEKIKQIFTEEHINKTFSELENINDLQKCIEEWKLETVPGSTKSNEELFRGNGWKPTKVQILLNSIESAIDKTLLAKQSSTGVKIQSSH